MTKGNNINIIVIFPCLIDFDGLKSQLINISRFLFCNELFLEYGKESTAYVDIVIMRPTVIIVNELMTAVLSIEEKSKSGKFSTTLSGKNAKIIMPKNTNNIWQKIKRLITLSPKILFLIIYKKKNKITEKINAVYVSEIILTNGH